jgi:hypothetical protein
MLPAVKSARTRRTCALVAIVALLVAQLAVVAYACPLDAMPAMTTEMPCHEAGGALEPQCTAHCQIGAQSVDQPKPLAAADVVAPLLAVVAVDLAAPAPRAVRAEAVPARAAAPPFPILYHRLLN